MRIVRERVKEDDAWVTYYKCSKDSTILWEELDNGFCFKGSDCKHFEWTPVGNGCYPDQLDPVICEGTEEIVGQRIKKIDEGTTVWFLIPKTQRYSKQEEEVQQ